MDQNNNSNSKPEQIIIHKNNSTPLVAAIIFLALVIGAGAIYVGDKNNNSKITPLTPTLTSVLKPTTPTQTPENIDSLPSWEIHESKKMKDLSFPGFNINYPPEWTLKEERNDIMTTITLKKGGSEIKITQSPTGGNLCVFEGNLPEGPANDYRSRQYKDIVIDNITFRRTQQDQNPGTTNYTFCSNSDTSKESFGIPTFIGNITYIVTGNDETTLSEMDQILSTIKIVN